MTKGNDFATEIDPIVNGNGYRKMASPENGKNNGSSRDTLSNQPRGEASDVAPREIRRRGRKRGSTAANSALSLEPRRRKRDSEVIVGERIRRLRLEAGLSQEELGRSSKMSTSYISRLETGEVNPTVDALTRIVRVFGLSIDGLLELDTDSPQILSSEELDPEIRVWLFKLKGKPVSARTKRIIQTVIEEELKDLENEAAS